MAPREAYLPSIDARPEEIARSLFQQPLQNYSNKPPPPPKRYRQARFSTWIAPRRTHS